MPRLSRLVVVAFVAATGCAGQADVMLPQNPLVSKRLEANNEIVKESPMVESSHGLPPGTLQNRARLARLDDQQACFEVSLHSLQGDMDLKALKTVLKEPKTGKIEGGQIWVAPTTRRSYDGLVDERRQTGTETVCSSKDSYGVCQAWQTRPTYAYYKVPGVVNVYESNGRVCFNHAGLVTAQSERVILDLFWVEMAGWMPVKHGVAFRWGFPTPQQKGT